MVCRSASGTRGEGVAKSVHGTFGGKCGERQEGRGMIKPWQIFVVAGCAIAQVPVVWCNPDAGLNWLALGICATIAFVLYHDMKEAK